MNEISIATDHIKDSLRLMNKENSDDLIELFALFSLYLEKIGEFKGCVHYLKQVQTLKEKQKIDNQQLKEKMLQLIKIQRYVITSQISTQQSNQIDVFLNIMQKLLNHFQEATLRKMIISYLMQNLPQTLLSKLVSMQELVSLGLQHQYCFSYNILIEQSQIKSLRDYLLYEKQLIFQNKQSKEFMGLLEKIDLEDLRQVLDYHQLIFKNQVFYQKKHLILVKYLNPNYLGPLLETVSYISFLNEFLILLYESNKEEVIEGLFKNLVVLMNEEFFDKIKSSSKFYQTILTKLVQNVLVINSAFNIIDMKEQIYLMVIEMVEINKNFSKKNCCNLLKVLIQ